MGAGDLTGEAGPGLEAALRGSARALFIVFVASIPAEYALVLPIVGSVSRLVGAVLLLDCATDVLYRGVARRLPAVIVVLAAFVVWSLASVAWSFEPLLSANRAITYFQLLVMAWVIWENIRREEDLVAAAQAYVLGALLVAVVTVWEFQSSSFALSLITTDVRVAAFGANPNELALTMVTAIPIALLLLRRSQSRTTALANVVYLILGTLAVVLTASRAGAVALAVAVLAMLPMFRESRPSAKVMVAFGLLCLLVLFISVVPDYTLQRIASIGAKLQRMDFNNRTMNWAAGLEMFSERPLLGVGAGAFEGATAHLIDVPRSSHSTWIGVLVETGVVGAVLWISAIWLALLELRFAPALWRRALLAAILPMLVGMLVTGWDHRKVPWFLLVLATCAADAITTTRAIERRRGAVTEK